LGIFLYVKRSETQVAQAVSVQSEAERRELLRQDDQTLQTIVSRTIEAMGGLSRLESISSLHKSGKLYQSDNVYAVEYYFKRPNQLRFRLEREAVAMTMAYDGEIAWRQIEVERVARPWVALDNMEQGVMRRNAEMVLPVTRFFNELQYLTKLPDADVGEHACFVVQYEGPLQATQVFYIDKVEYLVRKRTRTDRFNDGPERELEVLYLDYRQIEGRQIAFEEDVIIDGVPDNRFVVDEVTVNPGILGEYFSPPPSSELAVAP
jgi:hypothetical protein